MVEFRETGGGYEVIVDNIIFGYIDNINGFFIDPTTTKNFMIISPDDLKKIAEKAEKAMEEKL